MHCELVDNQGAKFRKSLVQLVSSANDLRVAVAFLSSSGLKAIQPALDSLLQSGGQAEFLIGFEPGVTEPTALRTLADAVRKTDSLRLYCYSELRRQRLFHPKLYLARGNSEVMAAVGSSNLTSGGLTKNIEMNFVMRLDAEEEIVSDLYAAYNSLKFATMACVEPSEALLSLYEEASRLARKTSWNTEKEAKRTELAARFREEANALRRPAKTPESLHGWQRLVYEALPSGSFKTSDAYAFERDFSERYPINTRIQEKIRQVLQQLRDMRFLVHVSRGHWRKDPLSKVTES